LRLADELNQALASILEQKRKRLKETFTHPWIYTAVTAALGGKDE